MSHIKSVPDTKKEFVEILEELIDFMVVANEDMVLDDMIPDLIADGDRRQDAFENLLEMAEEELDLLVKVEPDLPFQKGKICPED